MKTYIGIFVSLIASTTAIAQLQKKETIHFSAKYNVEAEEYAIASLEILEATWSIATNNGYYLPQKIKFSIKKSDRNALYFNRKNLKEIIWEYEFLSEFLPPDESKKNNIYGLCHEIGHLCMYNTNHNRNSWMSHDYREAWADYFGNMIIDSIYDELGIEIWPQIHDYKKFAGMEYFLNRIEKNNPKLNSFNNAGLFWYELGSGIGFDNIQFFFNSLKDQKVDNLGAAGKFKEVLKEYLEVEKIEEWFEKYAENLIINKE